jgi:hypothetical protein
LIVVILPSFSNVSFQPISSATCAFKVDRRDYRNPLFLNFSLPEFGQAFCIDNEIVRRDDEHFNKLNE